MGQAFSAPVINDVSTDMNTPPTFTKSNHPATLSQHVKDAIRNHYSDLKPLRVTSDKPVADVVEAVKAAAQASLPRGQVVYESSTGTEGAVELLDVTGLMRFKDDVSIRIKQDGADVVIDFRSASRVGKGDLGCNAARIRTLIAALKTQLGVAASS